MRILICLAILIAPAFSWADEFDGNYFARTCFAAAKRSGGGALTSDEQIGALICSSYVTGYLDAFVLSGDIPLKKLICLPERGLTVEQVERVFLKYLMENPETLHEPGRGLLMRSLGKAFPCKW